MSKLIKILEDNTVLVFSVKEGIDLEKEALKVEGIVYEKEIPKSNFLKWENDSVVEDIKRKQEYESTLNKKEIKLQKQKELNELVIDHNTVLYDAHGEALGNMATVIAIANAIYNRAISVGINGTIMDLVDAYNYVYKNQTVTWKGADNKPHTVQLESLVEASQKAMTAKAEILFKY